MDVGLLVFLAFISFFIFVAWISARSARKGREKQEAYFASMFPDLQPYYHPKNVLEFVRARLEQPPARGGMTIKGPPGFATAHSARVSFDTDKKGRERELWTLLDEGGRELTRFFFESDAKDGMVRVGEGKFRVGRHQNRVRYWHPDRELKWTPPGMWKFVTRVAEQPFESSRDSGTSFSDSSSSRTATTAAAAAGIAAAGGTFDGGGASAGWDDKSGGGDSSSDTSAAGATSY